MKKPFILTALFLSCTIALALVGASCHDEPKKIFKPSNAMKFDDGIDLSAVDGADAVERLGDHPDSPYFQHVDFYNARSAGSLTILQHFPTIQQSSEWSCGPACALMVLRYFGRDNGYNEQSLARLRPQGDKPGATSLREELEIFQKIGGFRLISTLDYKDRMNRITLRTLREFLAKEVPILICWNDWGGHWQVIIGYDTMATPEEQDDVIIVADPYDTTDHNQDGYGIIPAQRFIHNFTTYNFFPESEGNDKLFIVANPGP